LNKKLRRRRRLNTVKDHGTSWYPSAVDFAIEHNLASWQLGCRHGGREPIPRPSPAAGNRTKRRPVMDAIKHQRTAAGQRMLWGARGCVD